jgi:hypothetical protein
MLAQRWEDMQSWDGAVGTGIDPAVMEQRLPLMAFHDFRVQVSGGKGFERPFPSGPVCDVMSTLTLT